MKTIKFSYVTEEGEELVLELPAKYEVCGRCRGEGSHTNPAIDGNGITASEWAEWDDEDREHYLSGAYDVPCEECHGARVVLVVDREDACPKLLASYDAQVEAEAASRRESDYERAYFARMEG